LSAHKTIFVMRESLTIGTKFERQGHKLQEWR